MYIIFLTAIAYIVFFFLYAILSMCNNKKWMKQDFRLLLIFLICLTFISYFVVPSSSDDLSRHFAYTNWFRFDKPAVYTNTIRPLPESTSLIYIAILKIVSRLSNNHFLPVIWLAIDYVILYVLIKKYTKNRDVRAANIYFYLLLLFGFISYYASVSNLRFPCVCFLMFLGIYYDLYENKKRMLYILTVIAMLIHDASLFIFLIWIVYKIIKKNKVYVVLIFWTSIVNIMIKVLNQIPINYVNLVGKKLDYYFNTNVEYIDVRLMILYIVFLIFAFCCTIWSKKNLYLSENLMKYNRFLECLIFFTIGSVVNPTMFIRCTMFLGVTLLPFNEMVLPLFRKKRTCLMIECTYGIIMNYIRLLNIIVFFSFEFNIAKF